MEDSVERLDALIRSGARRLTGYQRRSFQAEVAAELCGGNARQAERRFGWGRETVEKGLHERHHGIRCLEDFAARGRQRSEEKDPQLAADIRAIVEPHTHADPELKSSRRYTNLSAAEVRQALIDKGYHREGLPSERTMRDILNRMNYRLKRIQKGKPLKKTEQTDAIFANVKAVREQVRDDPATLEISMDTKAKVALGDYVRGGKTRTGSDGEVTKGWDHDPPAKEKLTPFGILMVASGALMLLFGSRETSDAWVDALKLWWQQVRVGPRARQAAGDLPGQRAEELGASDAVPEADGGVRRLVGAGDPAGVLSAVPQQVQPDRAVLVGAGEEVERGVAEQPGGGPAMRPADDLEGVASDA